MMTGIEKHKAQPPHRRSQAAGGLGVAAAQGRFALQVCQECEAVQYPPRDVCGVCLSEQLVWTDIPDGGDVLAVTMIRATGNPYFRELAPWRTGIVRLDCGPSVIAHLHGSCTSGDRARLSLKVDSAGNGVMFALPAVDLPEILADRQLQQFVCDPRSRTVFLLGANKPVGMTLARKLAEAGAARVLLVVDDPAEFAKLSQTGEGSEALEIVPRQEIDVGLSAKVAAASVDTVIALIETSDDLISSNAMRDEMHQRNIRIYNIFLPSPDTAAEAVATAAITALRQGVEDVFVGGAGQEFLQPSAQWPGLSAYDHKE
jgi:uncharacterized OB-fold protein